MMVDMSRFCFRLVVASRTCCIPPARRTVPTAKSRSQMWISPVHGVSSSPPPAESAGSPRRRRSFAATSNRRRPTLRSSSAIARRSWLRLLAHAVGPSATAELSPAPSSSETPFSFSAFLRTGHSLAGLRQDLVSPDLQILLPARAECALARLPRPPCRGGSTYWRRRRSASASARAIAPWF